MKRSEMIEVMIKADREISNCSSLYHMFSDILAAMEKAGMLPPNDIYTNSDDCYLKENWNKWEPEKEVD